MEVATAIRIHRMGRCGRKSQNQKSRVTKIKNLGYKSGEREPERKLRTNLSWRWSWRSESSANRSLMVALRSPCTVLFSAMWWMSRWRRSGYSQRWRGGQRVSWWPAATWVDEKRVCVWRREEIREEESRRVFCEVSGLVGAVCEGGSYARVICFVK